MPTHLSTDHQTRFVIEPAGLSIKVQRSVSVVDRNGGMDFQWRTIATYNLARASHRNRRLFFHLIKQRKIGYGGRTFRVVGHG